MRLEAPAASSEAAAVRPSRRHGAASAGLAQPWAAFVLAVLLLEGLAGPAIATVRIAGDYGGRIGAYMDRFKQLRASGDQVEIDGDCVSACTLLLGYIPRDRLCVTSKARLGFHAAWKPDVFGFHVFNAAGTDILLRTYPRAVKKWIADAGGLSLRMKYLSGPQLRAIYKACR